MILFRSFIMLKSRGIKLLFIIFLLFFGFRVFSYDNLIIHPSLSRGASEIYNSQAEKKLTKEQISWIVEGSIAEDTDPRYVNHYYDPTTGLGLNDGFPKGLPAKIWAKNQNSVSGDYSESAIFNNYREGDLKRAYQGIGHILHLIQDMSVPAHTRNDSHAMGDPYEKWTQQYGNVSLNRVNYIYVNNLDNAFDELAVYSNANFFSEDTVDKNFLNNTSLVLKKEKNLKGEDVEYIYYNEYKLIQIIKGLYSNDYLFDFKVHLDYWNMLYPKAIGYSAGAIDYFVREFKKIDEDLSATLKAGKLSFWDKINNVLGDFFDNTKYVWGDTFLASRVAASEDWSFWKGGTAATWEGAKYFTQANVEILKDAAGRVLSATEGLTLQDVLGVKVADTADKELSFKDNKEPGSEASEPGSLLSVGVERVIDGDTIILTSGETVRYIGVDTPELNSAGSDDDECLAWTARLRNMQLLGKGDLKLVKDQGGDKDKYGRSLYYVYAKGIFINEILAREGLAKDFFCQPGWTNCPLAADSARKNLILTAAKDARENKRGIYSDVCQEDKIVKKETEVKGIKIKDAELGSGDKEEGEEEDWLVIFGAKGNIEDESLEPEEDPSATLGTGPEIIPTITSFNIASLTSSSPAYTASTTVELDYEIENQDLASGYYLSENSAAPGADNENWATSSPTSFVLSSGDGEKNVYFWLRYNENQVSAGADASITLDTTAPAPPTISSIAPLENVYWVNSSQVSLSGNKESLVDKIFINNNEYSATSSEETWQAEIDIDFICPQTDFDERMNCIMEYCLPDMEVCGGEDNIEDVQEIIHVKNLTFKSQDEAGNQSPEAIYEFKLDFGSPTVGLFSGFKSLARRKLYMAVMAGDPAAGGGFGLQSGVVGYEWQYRLNGSENWLDVGSLSTMETDEATLYLFAGEAGSSYVFQLRAIDKAGNYSPWSSAIGKTVSASFPGPYPVISEIYAGGGNSGSYWKNDFIELYNPNDFMIALDGWSVQYAAASSSSWSATLLSGSIPANGYYLVKEYQGAGGEAGLPAADAVGEINLNATAGKVALVNNAEPISGKTDQNAVDFVGYGAANENEGSSSTWSPGNDKSLERLAFIDSGAGKMASGGEHETGGNGWDSNNNFDNFAKRNIPEPQNSGESETPVD